jgi:hypothetical protein
MSIYIDGTQIRVARAGINAQTASEDELVLSISQRTGQILEAGWFGVTSNPSTSAVTGSSAIGPFSRAPELIGYMRSSDGYVHVPSCITFDETVLGGPPQLAETFVCSSMTLDNNSISFSGFYRESVGAPPGTHFAYLIYRKPNRG